MNGLVPGLISAAIYLAFQKYAAKRQLGKNLYLEALAFAVVTYAAMWGWRTYMGYEGMANTHGDVCPDGYIKTRDPMNSQQTTCVPNPSGRATYNPTTGFGAIPSDKK
jgi:hypothetical protein